MADSTLSQQALTFSKEIRKTVSLDYLLYLPPTYAPAGEPRPLLLFLHGAGERGNDLELLKKHGPPRLIDRGEALPFVVVSPQCPADQWWDTEALIALVDEATASHRIDSQRVYVTGLSMGGFGTWKLAIEYPNRFAAIAPICGGGMAHLTRRITHVPIWVFHGAKDQTVPLRESQSMVDALKRYGGDARLTIYPEAQHDSWTETYDNPELYTWLLSHRLADGPAT